MADKTVKQPATVEKPTKPKADVKYAGESLTKDTETHVPCGCW